MPSVRIQASLVPSWVVFAVPSVMATPWFRVPLAAPRLTAPVMSMETTSPAANPVPPTLRFSTCPTFSGPFPAGGCGWGVDVMIAGIPLIQPPLDLHFTSPDFDGNQVVDLTDVVLFAASYFGNYGDCFDLHHDGSVNLSDLVVLAEHWGHHCP